MRGILFEAYLKRILGECLSENRRNDVSEFRINLPKHSVSIPASACSYDCWRGVYQKIGEKLKR